MHQVQFKPTISFSDFQKLDLRVGKVTFVERKEGSKNLLRLKVNFGKDIDERSILAGLVAWYHPEDLVNRKFIFVTNLEPKKMMGEESQGMILCAVGDNERAVVVQINDKIQEGTIIR